MSPFSASVSPYIKYIAAHLEMQKGIFTLPTYIISLYSSKRQLSKFPLTRELSAKLTEGDMQRAFIYTSRANHLENAQNASSIEKILSRLRQERINCISGNSISPFANGDSRRCPKNPQVFRRKLDERLLRLARRKLYFTPSAFPSQKSPSRLRLSLPYLESRTE